jgi:ribonucleotide reductase alpha subunit
LKEGGFDFKELQKVVRHIVISMNRIIDSNKYPTGEAWTSNMKNRPIGIGVQGLNDVFQNLELPYDSQDAKDLDALIFETIYFAAVTESCELAKKGSAYGSFPGSPTAMGILQFDFWPDTTLHYDWADLKLKVIQYGLRNSLLTAVMPTASTSQIQGNTEEVTVPQTNLYSRQTLAGKFMQVNKAMVFKLMMRGVWDEKMAQKLLNSRGSVQDIDGFQADLKPIFKTVWETKMKDMIDHARARAPFIDQ